MNSELEEKLIGNCPNVFTGWRARREEKLRSFCGAKIEAEDGWYGLIESLVSELEIFIREQPEQDRARYGAAQIKERMGTLTFYLRDSQWPSSLREAHLAAIRKSSTTCEICGDAES